MVGNDYAQQHYTTCIRQYRQAILVVHGTNGTQGGDKLLGLVPYDQPQRQSYRGVERCSTSLQRHPAVREWLRYSLRHRPSVTNLGVTKPVYNTDASWGFLSIQGGGGVWVCTSLHMSLNLQLITLCMECGSCYSSAVIYFLTKNTTDRLAPVKYQLS